MYKILVVDDEQRHRIGLSNIIKEISPKDEVYQAKNGQEAYQLVKENKIDIITDIKMPVMDGLKLIECLGEKVSEIKIIILTAYGYFEYAQKAINLGAFDYLLKPVDKNKVVEMLNKAKQAIERSRIEKQEKDELKKLLDGTFPTYLEFQLNKWIKGKISKNKLAEIEKIFPYKGPGTVIMIYLKNFGEITANLSNTTLEKVKISAKYWMKEALNPVAHSLSFFLNDSRNTIMVTILIKRNECRSLPKDSLRPLHDFIKKLNTKCGICSIVGVGSLSENVIDDISQVFLQAQKALRYSFFLTEKEIIYYYEVKEYKENKIFMDIKKEFELTEAIQKLSKERAVCIFNDICSQMIKGGFPEPEQFKDAIIHILLYQIKNLFSAFDEERISTFVDGLENDLRECTNYNEFTLKCKYIIYKIIDTLDEQRNFSSDMLFNKCLEYINENYAQDISLDKVAEEFYFNSSYFSSLFKNKTGINFSQYLLHVRLRKGKELLESTDYKVYEIAEMVGYKDSKYFNRVFKKEFGVTPDEYRRLQFAIQKKLNA